VARLKPKLVPPKLAARGGAPQRWTSAFIDYLRGECRLADNTVAAYTRDLSRFQSWLAGGTAKISMQPISR